MIDRNAILSKLIDGLRGLRAAGPIVAVRTLSEADAAALVDLVEQAAAIASPDDVRINAGATGGFVMPGGRFLRESDEMRISIDLATGAATISVLRRQSPVARSGIAPWAAVELAKAGEPGGRLVTRSSASGIKVVAAK